MHIFWTTLIQSMSSHSVVCDIFKVKSKFYYSLTNNARQKFISKFWFYISLDNNTGHCTWKPSFISQVEVTDWVILSQAPMKLCGRIPNKYATRGYPQFWCYSYHSLRSVVKSWQTHQNLFVTPEFHYFSTI